MKKITLIAVFGVLIQIQAADTATTLPSTYVFQPDVPVRTNRIGKIKLPPRSKRNTGHKEMLDKVKVGSNQPMNP